MGDYVGLDMGRQEMHTGIWWENFLKAATWKIRNVMGR